MAQDINGLGVQDTTIAPVTNGNFDDLSEFERNGTMKDLIFGIKRVSVFGQEGRSYQDNS